MNELPFADAVVFAELQDSPVGAVSATSSWWPRQALRDHMGDMIARTNPAHWNALWHNLGAHGDPSPWHARLSSAYAAPARQYHTLRHIEECLIEFDAVRGVAQQSALVEAALWFHDAVYDPRSTTNEEDSAMLAADCLRNAEVAAETIDTVQQLILSTKTHEPGDTPDAPLLIDIDLAILGQRSERFWQYEQAIRTEFAWADESTYRQRRSEVLQKFLDRPAIFRTTPFRVRYEATARTNLKAAIQRLLN